MNPSFRTIVPGAMLCLGACATSGPVAELDKQIKEQRALLESATQQLNATAPPIFVATTDLQADLSFSPVRKWLARLTSPSFAISTVGVAASGDVVYVGGVGKAWIGPPQDSNARLHIQDMRVNLDPTGIHWSATAAADAAIRFQTYIFNTGSNINCTGNISRVPITGAITFQPVEGNQIPYQIDLYAPGNIKVDVPCGLGQIGNVRESFSLGTFSPTISKGNVPLGWSTGGTICAPPEISGVAIAYTLSGTNPIVDLTEGTFHLKTDVTISTAKQPCGP